MGVESDDTDGSPPATASATRATLAIPKLPLGSMAETP